MSTVGSTPDPERQAAIDTLRKRRAFTQNLLAYVVVNAFLIGIWLITTPGGFFWPAFPLLGWGIGLVFHARDVYARGPSEDQVQREIQRQRPR